MGVVGYGSSTYLKIMVIEHNINWKATSSDLHTHVAWERPQIAQTCMARGRESALAEGGV